MTLSAESHEIWQRVSRALTASRDAELQQRLAKYTKDIDGWVNSIRATLTHLDAMQNLGVNIQAVALHHLSEAREWNARAVEEARRDPVEYGRSGTHGEMLACVRLVIEQAKDLPTGYWREFRERTKSEAPDWGVLARMARRVAKFENDGRELERASSDILRPGDPTPQRIQAYLEARERGERVAQRLRTVFEEKTVEILRAMSREEGVPIDEVPQEFWDWVERYDSRGDVVVRLGRSQ